MRAVGRRKKKLIVAFHFQFANQAAWRCDICRSQALETRRRCGWLELKGEPEKVIWARGAARTSECPKSFITAESLEFIERYQAGRVFGFGDVLRLPARVVDAFCVLELEMAKEKRDGNE